MKKFTLIALSMCMMPCCTANADTFTFAGTTSPGSHTGTISDGAGTFLANFELFNDITAGSTESADRVLGGSNGARTEWNFDTSQSPSQDMAAIRLRVSNVNPLYTLDSITFSQSNYDERIADNSGKVLHNGGQSSDASPIYSLPGYTGAFTENDTTTVGIAGGNLGGQISTPLVGTGLTWTQNTGFFTNASNPAPNNIPLLPNDTADWSVTATDVSANTFYNYRVAAVVEGGGNSGELFREFLSVDTSFSLVEAEVAVAVPEPSSLALLGLGGLSLLLRRRR